MTSNVSAAAQTSGSRHTRRALDVPSGRLANTTSSRPALSCSIKSALTPICTSSFTPGWSAAKRPRAEGSEPHRRGQPRRAQARAGRLLELQQATRVAEQHLPVIRQRDAACRAPEQGGGDPRTKTPLASGNESDLATGYGRLTRSESGRGWL